MAMASAASLADSRFIPSDGDDEKMERLEMLRSAADPEDKQLQQLNARLRCVRM